MAEEAKADPFLVIRKTSHNRNTAIPIERWVQHFSDVLNMGRKDQAYDTTPHCETTNTDMEIKFSRAEVEYTIGKTKNKKATGPDKIAYEHLKETKEPLGELWTELFNKCLQTGTIPEEWRRATLKILYKGKGSTNDLNSYRGIALENTTFKTFTKLVTN